MKPMSQARLSNCGKQCLPVAEKHDFCICGIWNPAVNYFEWICSLGVFFFLPTAEQTFTLYTFIHLCEHRHTHTHAHIWMVFHCCQQPMHVPSMYILKASMLSLPCCLTLSTHEWRRHVIHNALCFPATAQPLSPMQRLSHKQDTSSRASTSGSEGRQPHRPYIMH